MNSHNPHFPVRSVIIFGNICLYSGDYVGTMQAIYILRGVRPEPKYYITREEGHMI
jgi:hypothetical protein